MSDPLYTQIGIGGVFAILVIREFRAFAVEYSKRKNGYGNGNGNGSVKSTHNTFADNPNLYWSQMRDVVTTPIADAINRQAISMDKQTEAFNELLREFARQQGRWDVAVAETKRKGIGA